MSLTLTISDTLYELLEAEAHTEGASSVKRYLEKRSRTDAHAAADRVTVTKG